MKRYLIRDVARNLRSHFRFRYMISVIRQLGGVEPRTCNICGFEGLFHAAGQPPRYDAQCPRCGSQERVRLLRLFLDRFPDFSRGADLVHFAPEPLLQTELRARAKSYRSADLHMPGCDLVLDIERLDLPDSSVDLFVVNHVIEHVDDEKALAQLFRCLRPGGQALITCPVVEGWSRTYENEAVAAHPDDYQRWLHFRWGDHRRYYGADLRLRIAAAGFELDEFEADGEETVRFSLQPGERIFIARRPIAPM